MTPMDPGAPDRPVGMFDPPTWSTWRGAVAVVLHRPHLRKTVTIALIVGTVLFCINQLDVVLRGDATAMTWIKSAVTYLVPFCVSNAGVLVASRVERHLDDRKRDRLSKGDRAGPIPATGDRHHEMDQPRNGEEDR